MTSTIAWAAGIWFIATVGGIWHLRPRIQDPWYGLVLYCAYLGLLPAGAFLVAAIGFFR